MTSIKKALKFIRVNNYHSHFAVEIFVIFAAIVIAGANLLIHADLGFAKSPKGSLLFSYLSENRDLNPGLVERYHTVTIQLGDKKQAGANEALAASTKTRAEAQVSEADIILPTLSGSALLKPNPPGSGSPLPKKDTQLYQVRGGDTVARIALAYGVSVDTILWENNLTQTSYIQPGQDLKILPTTGVKHTIKSGETISEIAKKYDVHEETIFEYNGIELEDHIFPGEELIIPNGAKQAPATPQREQYLASLKRNDYETADASGYQGSTGGMIWPLPGASRISQYYWSRHRALDIPCSNCAVVASAGGIVELAGWQGGYGYTIVVNHGNGVKTRYAHATRNLVSAGQRVSRGQTVMISGSTGRSTGPHLHFEVIKNGVYLNPLNVVSR